jgi:hypothetical protein
VGDKTQMQRRTRWTPAAGERTDFHDDVLVCASKGVDEGTLEGTYPYGLSECRPYRGEFLSGWAAEEYAVDLKRGWEHARRRVNEEEVRRCAREVPGDTHRNLRVWTQHAGVTWKHLLLPLWIATYRWRDKGYRFLVNGQTGKVAGTAPVSWVKVSVAVVLGIAAVLAILWFANR